MTPNEIERIRRLLAPRADGKLLVDKEIADQFNDLVNGGRDQVLKLWEQCGGNKDTLV